jgi:hypothetical protein
MKRPRVSRENGDLSSCLAGLKGRSLQGGVGRRLGELRQQELDRAGGENGQLSDTEIQ